MSDLAAEIGKKSMRSQTHSVAADKAAIETARLIVQSVEPVCDAPLTIQYAESSPSLKAPKKGFTLTLGDRAGRSASNSGFTKWNLS